MVLKFWSEVERGNWDAVEQWHQRIEPLFQFLADEFAPRGFTDTAFDRLGAIASGFLQTSLRLAPYAFAYMLTGPFSVSFQIRWNRGES